MESDFIKRFTMMKWDTGFQSTLSKRRATSTGKETVIYQFISIHALQAESDGNGMCGHLNSKLFQSTLSKRRATWRQDVWGLVISISIHALQAESDWRYVKRYRCKIRFQSTLSKRRATRLLSSITERIASYFNPRSPSGERPLPKVFKPDIP